MTVDLSFVILTWNSCDYIKDCIQSVFKALKGSSLEFEIYIVDNGSSDGTVPFLEQLQIDYPQIVKPIFLDSNTGTTYSRNLALKKASGTYICIMDSDVEIFSGGIEKLIEHFNQDASIGLCVPRINYPNGKLQKSTDIFPTITHKAYRYFFLKNIEEKENKESIPLGPIKIDYAISAFWLFKKEVKDHVGLLDEKIFYAPEDVDYCLRIWKKGYQIIYDNSVSVVHHTQEISRGFKINKAFISHIKGLCYYFLKHRYFFQAPAVRNK